MNLTWFSNLCAKVRQIIALAIICRGATFYLSPEGEGFIEIHRQIKCRERLYNILVILESLRIPAHAFQHLQDRRPCRKLR